jgi:V/A-type H+-transporting ATPase subunit I
MAIEPMERISIVAHRDLEDQVVDALARLGTVHLEQVGAEDGVSPKQLSEEEAETARQYSFDISKIEFLRGFLKRYKTEKTGFVGTLIKPKFQLTYDDFMKAGDRFDLDTVYRECFTMDRRYLSLTERKERLERELSELEYWTDLEIPMSELKGNPTSHLLTIRVAAAEVVALSGELAAGATASSLEVIGKDDSWAACLLLFSPDCGVAVASILAEHATGEVALRDLTEEPAERLEQVRREIAALDRRRESIRSRTASYGELLPGLEVLGEMLTHQRGNLVRSTEFGATKKALVLEGWVTASSRAETLERIGSVGDDLAIETRAPLEGESPPTSLSNPRWLKPFEMLVEMFGPPNRGESDPTIIVAISFMIFFGFCIADVGYGVCLAIALFLMRRYLPLGVKSKQFLIVLTYGAVWASIIGVLAGSWFGIETSKLPQPLQSMAVLEGLSKTVLAMAVVMGIGVVHMLIGVGVEFRDNWRDGNRSDALIDQGLIFLLFVGGGLTGALAAMKVVPVSVPEVVVLVAILLMIGLLGRSARSVPGKLANGLYETYGVVVGFISDTISYVRLFALGLATFMIAYVINTMSGMVLGIAPVVGVILMLLILVLGHTFNLAINLLGAFVHPLRLEFVEFFGKFYEDGGRPFKPMRVDSRTVIIDDGQSPRLRGKGGGK